MTIILLAFGLVMIGYSVVIAIFWARHRGDEVGDARWVVLHVSLRASIGVIALLGALVFHGSREIVLLIVALLLVDAAAARITRRRACASDR